MPQLECDAPLCKASGGTFAAPGTVTELAGIQDLSIDSAMDKLDASSRGSRFKKNWLGMRDLIVTGKVLKTNNDADFEYLRDAHNNRTASYLIETPMLADYLEEALSQFGMSPEDFEEPL